jgi:hypothetical protein
MQSMDSKIIKDIVSNLLVNGISPRLLAHEFFKIECEIRDSTFLDELRKRKKQSLISYERVKVFFRYSLFKSPDFCIKLLDFMEEISPSPTYEKTYRIVLLAYNRDFIKADARLNEFADLTSLDCNSKDLWFWAVRLVMFFKNIKTGRVLETLFVEDSTHPLIVRACIESYSLTYIAFESIDYMSMFNADSRFFAISNLYDLNSNEEVSCFSPVPKLVDDFIGDLRANYPGSRIFSEKHLYSNRYLIEDLFFYQIKKAKSVYDLFMRSESCLFLLERGRFLDVIKSSDPRPQCFYIGCQFGEQFLTLETSVESDYNEALLDYEYQKDKFSSDKQMPLIASRKVLQTIIKIIKPRYVIRFLLRKPITILMRFPKKFDWLFFTLYLALVGFLVRIFYMCELIRLNKSKYMAIVASSEIYLRACRRMVEAIEKRGDTCSVIMRGSHDLPDINALKKEGFFYDYLLIKRNVFFNLLLNILNKALFFSLELSFQNKYLVFLIDGYEIPFEQFWKDRKYNILVENFMRSWLFEVFLNQCIPRIQPDWVFTMPDRNPEALLLISLQEKFAFRTFSIQTVYHSRHPRYKPLQASYGSVIDTWSERLFIEHFQAPRDRLILAGSPNFNAISEGLENNFRNYTDILFVGQRGIDVNLRNLDYVLKSIDFDNSLRLIVRPHPSENESELSQYNAIISLYPNVQASVSVNEVLSKRISRSFLVLTAYSNIALEAATYSVPVLIRVCIIIGNISISQKGGLKDRESFRRELMGPI